MTDPTPADPMEPATPSMEPAPPAAGWPAPAAPPPAAGWAPPPPPVQAGPAGFAYADVPNRAIAYIIDAIILFVIDVVVFVILAAIGLSNASLGVGSIIYTIVGLAISAAYLLYTWTAMRGTVGMKVLGMQIGNAGDGKTLTMDQAVRRWIALGAPFSIAQVFTSIAGIGTLIGLAAFAWFIFLVYTTAKSPTKQGYHDVFAHTMVVKAARVAG